MFWNKTKTVEIRDVENHPSKFVRTILVVEESEHEDRRTDGWI